MYKQEESWSSKDCAPSDPSSNKNEKLSVMQNSLFLAAETIKALKLEQQRLKNSLEDSSASSRPKTMQEPESFSTSKGSNKTIKNKELNDKIHYLNKIAAEKDKLIQLMERRIKDSDVEIQKFKLLDEKYAALRSELIKKEKLIICLEAQISNVKSTQSNSFLSDLNSEIKKEIADKNNMIELQTSQIKEFKQEKMYWKKLHDFFKGLVSENFDDFASSEKINDCDWEKFSESILALKTENVQKQEKIEFLEKKINETNYIASSNDLKDPYMSTDFKKKYSDLILVQLKETINQFLHIVRLNSSWHSYFKFHFTCSKKLKLMLENEEYGESLLKVMKVTIDILREMTENPFGSKINNLKLESTRLDIHKSSEKILMMSLGTQTPDGSIVSLKPSQVSFSPELEAKVNKNIQTDYTGCLTQPMPRTTKGSLQESILSNKSLNAFAMNNCKSQSSLSFRTPLDTSSQNLLVNVNKLNPQNYFPASSMVNTPSLTRGNSDQSLKKFDIFSNGKEYLKLIDESQLLLNVIDKQSSRLEKINSQISQLVPTSVETYKPGKDTSMSFINETDFDDRFLDSELTPRNETSPHWNSIEIQIPKRNSELKRKADRKESISPIRVIESPEKSPSPTRLSRAACKTSTNKTKPPDPLPIKKFQEYSRPKFSKEPTWNSVGQFFTKEKEENN